jgi:2Fe-2S ferredoxin
MPRITFIEANGTQHVIDAAAEGTLMTAARNRDIPGIVAECGGACACATCQIYLENGNYERCGKPGADEQSMLDFANGARPTSRLSCQIPLTEELDGLVVRLPESQF